MTSADIRLNGGGDKRGDRPKDFQSVLIQSPLPGEVASLRSCWNIFYPLALSMILSSSIGIVDMYLAGLIGPAAQAAVGIGDQLIFAVIVLGTGLSCATSSIISRGVGAQKLGLCRDSALVSLLIAISVGIFSTLAAVCISPTLMKSFHCCSAVEELAVPYTVSCSLANAPFIVVLCQAAIFRAMSRSDLALKVQLLTVCICHLLSLLLFFSGFDGSHSLSALSLAWIIASLAGAAYGSVAVWRLLYPASITSSMTARCTRELSVLLLGRSTAFARGREVCFELCKLALPAVIAELATVAANFLLYGICSGLSDSASAQAALTVKLKIEETIALIPIMALGMAASVIVGQNVGAGRNGIAFVSTIKIAKWGACVMLVVGAVTSLFARGIAEGFSADQTTQSAISNLLTLSIIYFPTCAFSTTMTNAIEGAGSTSLPMGLNLAILTFLRCACSFVCAISWNWGISGIAFAVCLTQIIMAFLSCVLLRYFFKRFQGAVSQIA